MNDRRNDPQPSGHVDGRRVSRELDADLAALRRESARDLPTLNSVVRAAIDRPRSWEEILMQPFETPSRRPWLPATLAGALAVIALLVIPISYERTTGHAVALTVSGPGLDMARVQGIAEELESLLHTDRVTVADDEENGAPSFVLSSTVPTRSRVDAAAVANALGSELERLGYSASARVTPVRERVMGSVYAYARDRVIRVDIAGKSAAQIEAEIRQQLTDAGITGAQVSVTQGEHDGQHNLQLKVEASKTATGAPGSAQADSPEPQIEITKGGQPLGGRGFLVRAERRKTPDGTTLTLHVTQDGKSVDVTVPHMETLSDAAITSQVEAQLKSAGIDATVQVSDGRVQVQAKR